MSKHLSVSQTVDLLETLRGVVRDFAAREAALNLEFRTKNEAAAKRLANQLAAQDAEFREEIRQSESTFSDAKEGLKAKYDQRKTRISKAQKSSQRQATERIDNEEGRKKYAVQKGTLEAERSREQRLKQNDAWVLNFENKLAETREQFESLEERTENAFRGYRKFRRLLTKPEAPHTELPADEDQCLEESRQQHVKMSADLERFSQMVLPAVFKHVPLWIWLVLILGGTFALAPGLKQFGIPFQYERQIQPVGIGLLGLVIIAYFFGQHRTRARANSIAQGLAVTRRTHEVCAVRARTRHAQEIENIENQTRERLRSLNREWDAALQIAAAARELFPKHLDEKWRRVVVKHEELHRKQMEAAEQSHTTALETLQGEHKARAEQLNQAHQTLVARWNAENQATWQLREAEWKARVLPIYERIAAANALAEEDFPSWEKASLNAWIPPESFQNAAKFGGVNLDIRAFAETAPEDKRLSLPQDKVSLPLVLTYPGQGSILFETRSDSPAIMGTLSNVIFRLLAGSPVGKLSFTIIDPVKLGQNFATIMHLADYEENLINGRILTQPNQIEERLADLNAHMEKVIQMYLRNEYETIAEYNLQAGNIAEKYHFVVIADFPANFTDVAARRLLHIAASGARCGVYTLVHWDRRHSAPADFLPEELRKSSVCINLAEDQFILAHPSLKRASLLFDAPPEPELATEFLQKVGEANRGSNRVEVPFRQVTPPPNELWSESTTEELRVPIGRSGATKLQYLAIGRGTRQHALIAGKTGSGKSTLFHVIITNLALWCSPEEVEFYLIDFKKGVEFKSYADARLPHARVVAIESDREFGLSVLQRVDEELKLRGELFRKLSVQDIPGYKKTGGTKPMPRSLLIIDEFQELFVEDDRISQSAAMLLDRIVRQGRAFGIHVLLGSQTLGGAYTLARTTIGQMVIRIALQCNEADAYLIMDENNPAPRLLSRPGEGIYNDMSGNIEGNSPFQAVWISDTERDEHLARVRALADGKPNAYPGPVVFEGNAPADVRENHLLRQLLEAPAIEPVTAPRVWLGAPNSIKGPTQAVFERRSGNNLLVVGQREEAVLAMFSVSLIALAAQFPIGTARLVLCESSAPGSPENLFLDRVIKLIPHEIARPKAGDLAGALNSLADDLKMRTDQDQGTGPATFLFIHGLQNFKKLRTDDDFSFSNELSETPPDPASQLRALITEGPSRGMHVIATLDTYNNVARFLGRKTLSEFEIRVLFQMSASDSATLCDDPKASTLGLHRALFYNEHEGYLETFRPYAMPGPEWLEAAAPNLARLKVNHSR